MLKFGERNSSYPEFKKNLPFTDCRYCVFDQDYESPDGRKVSRIWFISWFPKNATPYNKVAYASGKIKFGEMLPGAFDCQVSRYIFPRLWAYGALNLLLYKFSVEELDSVILGEQADEDGDDDDIF